MEKEMSFVAACKHYFGVLPGQTTLQFAAEVRALSDSDKAEIAQGLAALGYIIKSA